MYARALRGGTLSVDPTLSPPPAPTPVETDEGDAVVSADGVINDPNNPATLSNSPGIAITVQADTPSASAVANIESILRGVPGVRSAQTTSLALGGVSVLRVTFDGDPDGFRAAMEARGYQVLGSGTAIRIRRVPQLLPPDLSRDNVTGG
jgi:hypothetical protein